MTAQVKGQNRLDKEEECITLKHQTKNHHMYTEKVNGSEWSWQRRQQTITMP
jgi:hypothetical protein